MAVGLKRDGDAALECAPSDRTAGGDLGMTFEHDVEGLLSRAFQTGAAPVVYCVHAH